MEIERINDTTIKFYITYADIEDRGFDSEEIWYNRERGEEFFFEMINEAHDHENFEIEGPLWIQVQAFDKGLEIVVTRGQMNDGNVKLEIPVSKDRDDDVDESIVDMLDEQLRTRKKDRDGAGSDEPLSIVIAFKDLEDLLQLSKSVKLEHVQNEVYAMENTYYLHIVFDDYYDEDDQDNLLSRVLEYGHESDMSIHRISEYGKTVVSENGLQVLSTYFS
ncbi:negative regulator of genetic competence MecA [Geomicrobium sp. JCM 19037]|uniref:adaptor protein MecA n=1 Tax=unclassified Geomicrobium TaxID=2628951 RepID=UPI00045F1933|nr:MULTISPECIES: adaptor protein MecA [unclassified Geomicrobium]GAK05784.1 negative regulator of genetic competence MecA [Geomicrobium sp. JCM 19037]GAK11859.1 negative regulator of genetic competence MecA [Geomicrobium sp. JCM 19039]